MPLFSGCLNYFPRALLAVAEHSRKANDKHNPGEPLHWSKGKSSDHADCAARHLLDIGPTWDAVDPEFDSLHATALAWRALALLETVLERDRAPADDGWIEWKGGERPVSPRTRVFVRLRRGDVLTARCSAAGYYWLHRGIDDDIVAYKVVE